MPRAGAACAWPCPARRDADLPYLRLPARSCPEWEADICSGDDTCMEEIGCKEGNWRVLQSDCCCAVRLLSRAAAAAPLPSPPLLLRHPAPG